MSSSASERPDAPSSPFATLGNSSSDSKDSRRTGPRLKPPLEDISIQEAPLPPGAGLHPSVAPESLRKPFASLAPQKRKTSEPNMSIPGDAPMPGRMGSSPNISPSHRSAAASLPAARATCRKHGLAKGRDGQCMMCLKEAPAVDHSLGWKLMVALMVVAVFGAAVVAFTLK